MSDALADLRFKAMALQGCIEGIRKAIRNSREPEGTLRKIEQLTEWGLAKGAVAEPGEELPEPIDADGVLVNVGNLLVTENDLGFQVTIDGVPIDAKAVTVDLQQGRPVRASIDFFPEGEDGAGEIQLPGDVQEPG